MHNFKELLVWQKARELTKNVYVLTQKFPDHEKYAITSQIHRSCVSIASNIAEWSGRYHTKEFVQFLYIANGSLSELKSQLYISFDFNLISEEQLENYLKDVLKIENMIKAFARKIKESEFTGTKYKKTVV